MTIQLTWHTNAGADEIARLERLKNEASAEFEKAAKASNFWCPAGDRTEAYHRARAKWQAAVDAWIEAKRRL